MLRRYRPKQLVEVGSCFSSALVMDTHDRFLDGCVNFTFIEANPEWVRSFLTGADVGRIQLLETLVRQVPAQVFSSLERDDVLFIDSSYVTKIGSDVNYLFFEILPGLRPGVLVQIHAVVWPFEYRLEWMLEGGSWKEAFFVRAFLRYNDAFALLLFHSCLGHSLEKC